MRLAVPDLISPSYFPAIAAVELGLMRDEGLDVTLDLLFPVTDAAFALNSGEIDFLAGAAHAPLYTPEGWGETKLIAALSQNMYWFLVVDSKSSSSRGDLTELRHMRIGAAPGPDLGLKELLVQLGIDIAQSQIEIAPVPGTDEPSISFGVTAASALAEGSIDAFWANGMGAAVALRDGVGKIVFDARRDGGESASFTFPALMTSRQLIEDDPSLVSGAVRAIVRAQSMLRSDNGLATSIGAKLFPTMEAGLIEDLIRRDLPFYHAGISAEAVAGLNSFARNTGLASNDAAYEEAVAVQFAPLWNSQ